MDRPPLFTIDRREKKLLGVCSGLGNRFGIDPTIVRIGVVAAAIMISFKFILLAYVVAALVGGAASRTSFGRSDFGRRSIRRDQMSDFDRMGQTPRRGQMRDLTDGLDVTDRKLMAIDQHLATQNDALAREIEALRKEEQAK
jgi:phage shock protein C